MKKLLLAVFFLIPCLAHGQGGNALVLTGAGAPPASCAFMMFYVKTDGTFYDCPAGSFSSVAGGGGGDTITSPNSTLNVGGTSSATTLDLKGAAGQIMAGATPSLTATPTLGANGGTGGSLTFAGSTSGSAAVTVSSTGVLALPSGTTATSLTMTTPLLGTPTSGVITNLTGTCTACTANSATSVPAANVASGALANGMTATTQAAASNDTKLATDAYVDGRTAHVRQSAWTCADSSASGSAQVCNTTPTFTPAANDCIIYTTTTANTGAGLTLNVNSLGAKSVAKWQGTTTLVANDVLANKQVVTCYDGTNWELSTIGNAPSGSSAPTDLGAITYNSGGTSTFAAASANVAAGKLTVTHSTSSTLSPTNLVKWGSYTLEIIQDGTGGGVTLTLGTAGTCSAWKVAGSGGGAITLSTGASAIDLLTFSYDGTNCIATFGTNLN